MTFDRGETKDGESAAPPDFTSSLKIESRSYSPPSTTHFPVIFVDDFQFVIVLKTRLLYASMNYKYRKINFKSLPEI